MSLHRTAPPARTARLSRHAPLESRTPLRPAVVARTAGNGKGKSAPARRGTTISGRGESFPPGVAALLAERDPWCVHCGSPYDLQNHHRRIRGYGGDPRPHTHCACNGVRLCRLCHLCWVHADGREEAEAEGLIIPRAATEPWTHSVLVHTADGGLAKFPACDGLWADNPGEVAA